MLDRLGELFVLGFRGLELPTWLRTFASRHGLGGVVLFDYDVATRRRGRNISSPQQLRHLCRELASLSARPLICVDQEGGRVRRLREECGFQPYPSALAFNAMSDREKISCTQRSFVEMRTLGIHYNLAPVIDINSNRANPDIAGQQRAWSDRVQDIAHNACLVGQVARAVGLGLCAKHYPGIGGSAVNSHAEVMELVLDDAQLALFYRCARELHGEALLLSHGYVKRWDSVYPVSISQPAIVRLRERCPTVLLFTDDLQMRGLRRHFSAQAAIVAGVRAGVDLLLHGNNLLLEEECCFSWVEQVRALLVCKPQLRAQVASSLKRITARKEYFYAGVCPFTTRQARNV